MRISQTVTWDEYGISNTPSREAVVKERDKLTAVQKNEIVKNVSITNSSIIKRQGKINLLNEILKWKSI